MRKEGSQGLGLREAISGTKRRREQRRELAIEKAALALIEKMQIVRRVTEAVDRGENGIILYQGHHIDGVSELGIDQFSPLWRISTESIKFSKLSRIKLQLSKSEKIGRGLFTYSVMSEPSASILTHGAIEEDGVLFEDILNKISDLMDNEGISADWHWRVEQKQRRERMIFKLDNRGRRFYGIRSAVTGKDLKRQYKSLQAAEEAADAAYYNALREGKLHPKFADLECFFVSLTLCWCPEVRQYLL